MFKSKSYNVKKASEKNEKEEPKSSKSSSASGSMTLKKKKKSKVQITKNHQNIDKKSIRKKTSQNGKKMTHMPLKMKQKKQ